METPQVPINFVPVEAGEVLSLGTIKIRIMEDGTRVSVRGHEAATRTTKDISRQTTASAQQNSPSLQEPKVSCYWSAAVPYFHIW